MYIDLKIKIKNGGHRVNFVDTAFRIMQQFS